MTIPPDVSERMKRFIAEWNEARGNELEPGAGGLRLIAPYPLYRDLGQQGGLATLKQREPDGGAHLRVRRAVSWRFWRSPTRPSPLRRRCDTSSEQSQLPRGGVLEIEERSDLLQLSSYRS